MLYLSNSNYCVIAVKRFDKCQTSLAAGICTRSCDFTHIEIKFSPNQGNLKMSTKYSTQITIS